MIVLYGATGYTGHLVARALDRRGLPFSIAGRSRQKLIRLSGLLPSSPAWRVASIERPEALFHDVGLFVNCAGPFTDLARPIVTRAAVKGVHYLDISNELGHVHRTFELDALARRSGAAIVPGCGFEVALADCAAATLARGFGAPIDEIRVVYDIRGRGSSFGSRRSAIRALATSWLKYEAGRWQWAAPCRETRYVQFSHGPRPVLSFPSSELATIPRHVSVRTVTTWITMSRLAVFWAPVLLPVFAWLARGWLGTLVQVLVSRMFPPPESGIRSQDPFTIKVELCRGRRCRETVLSGKGVYDLTAEIVAYAAGQMITPGYRRCGVLSPAAALAPDALLDYAVERLGVVRSSEP
jgi:short subunit dehydrogenase-like uncharacterized protein